MTDSTNSAEHTGFVLLPISDPEADALRKLGGTAYVADEHPGFPCRQCLRDAVRLARASSL